jgi:MurNAc alpha-1-phosphate uridylyltransferase
MKAMIFAAGLGTRFKPWTDHHPKALAVVNGKTLLQRNVEFLQNHGIREVVVNVHHFADQVIEAIQKNKGWGSAIMISDESDEVLETGGGLVKARPLLQETDSFLTINADILTNLNITNLIEAHCKKNNLITLAVMQRDSSRQLLFDSEMNLKGWRNRLTGDHKGPFLAEGIEGNTLSERAFSGIALYQQEVFDLIKQKGKFSLTDVFLDLSVTHRVEGFDHSGDILLDVGSEEKLTKAEKVFYS